MMGLMMKGIQQEEREGFKSWVWIVRAYVDDEMI